MFFHTELVILNRGGKRISTKLLEPVIVVFLEDIISQFPVFTVKKKVLV